MISIPVGERAGIHIYSSLLNQRFLIDSAEKDSYYGVGRNENIGDQIVLR